MPATSFRLLSDAGAVPDLALAHTLSAFAGAGNMPVPLQRATAQSLLAGATGAENTSRRRLAVRVNRAGADDAAA